MRHSKHEITNKLRTRVWVLKVADSIEVLEEIQGDELEEFAVN